MIKMIDSTHAPMTTSTIPPILVFSICSGVGKAYKEPFIIINNPTTINITDKIELPILISFMFFSSKISISHT